MAEDTPTTTENHSSVSSRSESDRYLEFSLGNEFYAIPLLKVKEVIAIPATTPIPHAPSYFEGIMNLRGQVISIVDLRKKLGIKIKEESSESAVIIVDMSPIFLGVIVDSVSTVLAMSEDQINPPPNSDTKMKTDYITGVTFIEQKMTVLIDIAKILDINDIQSIHTASKKSA